MSSTLIVTVGDDNFRFKYPAKEGIARKYYDHDGSLGGPLMVVNTQDLLAVVDEDLKYATVRDDEGFVRLRETLVADGSPAYAVLEWEV